jgi:hypothetical protein
MPVIQLDQNNADRNLTSKVEVFSHQVTVGPTICQALIECGDGSKDCADTAGDWKLYVDVGSQSVEPYPQTISAGTAIRKAFWTGLFPVMNNDTVSISLKSPNGADSDVDVTATLCNVTGSLPAVVPAAAGGIITRGTGDGQLNALSGVISGMATAATQALLMALLGRNRRIDQVIRVGGKITAYRLRLYANAADAANEENELLTINATGTYAAGLLTDEKEIEA